MDKIYIAGALFTTFEREALERIDSLCKKLGYSTYLPHKDAGLFKRDDNNSASFFVTDRDNIDTSEIIIAVINGSDVDSGTAWEMGYGYSKNKIIIGYLEDIRIFNPNRQLNPMVLNSLNDIVTDIQSLEQILKKSYDSSKKI